MASRLAPAFCLHAGGNRLFITPQTNTEKENDHEILELLPDTGFICGPWAGARNPTGLRRFCTKLWHFIASASSNAAIEGMDKRESQQNRSVRVVRPSRRLRDIA